MVAFYCGLADQSLKGFAFQLLQNFLYKTQKAVGNNATSQVERKILRD